ncbi:MAG: aminotransferase class I/II-fold pyridoxal phosphate-dependent enzyme, partial [Deltaproteobacteria bacterium]|nr:aminotransferase class I/II-fold pyridoxal phosphate-dependent enzyme [Deltaproteobacteria bacterium]
MSPIPRHNVNLGGTEIATILWHLLNPMAVSGDEVRRFEDDFAEAHGVRHAVAVSSGRSALYSILTALDLPPSSEIIVPAYTFFTIPQIVRAAGHVPVFARCHPFDYAIDPAALEDAFSDRTAAVIVEHPFGQAAPMTRIMEIAAGRGVVVIEDPSQSI